MGRRGNDEGSIWKRSDGRWSGSYFVPTATGGRVRRYVYGATRDEVHAKLVTLMAQVERGLPVATTQETVGSYLRRWLAEVAAQRVRANTLTGYRTNIERHIDPHMGRKKLGKLAARDVRLMLDGCRQSGLSERSVRYVHATLRVALEDAVREDLVPRNVAKLVRLSTPPRKETRILSADEGRHLLKTTKDDRLTAALVLLLLLGLRRSEVLGLRWKTSTSTAACSTSGRGCTGWRVGCSSSRPRPGAHAGPSRCPRCASTPSASTGLVRIRSGRNRCIRGRT